MSSLSDSTPVLVGVGQVADPIDAAEYHRWGAVDLAAEAARAALDDAGLDGSHVDTVAGVRQFEISTPISTAPLGRSDNYPRSVARRVGADPRHAVLDVAGGQAPQHLITEFAKKIARGEVGTVLLFGSEAISTTRRFAGQDDAPDFTETVGGQLEDRGFGLDGLMEPEQLEHGLFDAPSQYGLLDNARRARLGLTRDAYRQDMARLFAPFTEVAAANPYAAAPVRRSADELAEVTERNRMIAEPYPRYLVARDQVNQGAAVVLTSVGAARAAGVPESAWVYLHGYADLREQNLLDRADLSRSPASVRAAATALERAGLTPDDLSTLDLYSCFAIAVSNICDGLGLRTDDPRGLTLTGGLPFFGGAGNNYSMHAVAETVRRVRENPGAPGFVGANGGVLSKYSAAVYSTEARAWEEHDDDAAQASLDAVPGPQLAVSPSGTATVETYTVQYGRGGTTGVVIARRDDGCRVIATTPTGDDATVAALLEDDVFGREVQLTSRGAHTYASTQREVLDRLPD
ncbi:acetyl-CoA acetyltransferase [Jatrophihabitans fulvus]